jgi:hypothetical protein
MSRNNSGVMSRMQQNGLSRGGIMTQSVHAHYCNHSTDALVASLPCRKRLSEYLVANGRKSTKSDQGVVSTALAMPQTFQAWMTALYIGLSVCGN